MRISGKLKSWNDEKGFGFIKPATGGKDVFIHISAFRNRTRRPELNQVVTFTLSKDKRNRPRAVEATLAGDNQKVTTTYSQGTFSIVLAVAFIVFVSIAVLTGHIPSFFLGIYLGLSLLCFVMYAKDKSAAQRGAWRTSETTLHLISLAGGWPGALIAQQKLRHKSKKQSFRIVFWITAALNVALFMWLLTPNGSAILQSIISNYHK